MGRLLNEELGERGPELVVLSACESGLPDVERDDELVGLPTAAIEAGARGVVSSLWPVREDATALLMARFADASFLRHLPPSRALRDAQLWLRSATGAELSAFVNARIRGIAGSAALAKSYDSLMATLEVDPSEKPFADPYFWAAFSFAGTDAALYRPPTAGSTTAQ